MTAKTTRALTAIALAAAVAVFGAPPALAVDITEVSPKVDAPEELAHTGVNIGPAIPAVLIVAGLALVVTDRRERSKQ